MLADGVSPLFPEAGQCPVRREPIVIKEPWRQTLAQPRTEPGADRGLPEGSLTLGITLFRKTCVREDGNLQKDAVSVGRVLYQRTPLGSQPFPWAHSSVYMWVLKL